MRRLVPVLALVACAACVPQAWRGFAPKMHFSTQVAAPTFKEVSLPNGLTLLVHEDRRAPVTSVYVAMRAGASTDPAGKAGVAALSEALAGRGAGKWDQKTLQQMFDRLGSPLGNQVGPDNSLYAVTVMPSAAAPALGLISQVVRNPRWDPKAFAQLKSQAITDAEIPSTDPQRVGIDTLRRTLFGAESAYARKIGGTPKTLKSITLDDLKAWHQKWIGPNTTAVILTGRVTFAQAIAWTREAFGKWKGTATVPTPPPAPKAPRRTAIEVVPEPGLSQTVMILGRVGVPMENPQRFPLEVATTFVGADMNVQLREEQHVSYGAYGGAAAFQGTGLLVALSKVKASATGEALQTSLQALRHTYSGFLDDRQVIPVRLGLIERELGGVDSTDGLASAAASIFLRHRPLNALVTDIRRLEGIHSRQVRKAAHAFLDPDTWQVVLVGDPKVIRKQVGSLGLGKLVIVPPPGAAKTTRPKATQTADAGR